MRNMARQLVPLSLVLALASCAIGLPMADAPPPIAQGDWERTYAQAVTAYEGGNYADSAGFARAAHGGAVAELGADTREAAAVLNLVAAAELAGGRYAEATAAFEEALATLRQSSNMDPEGVSAALGNLGELYRQQGQVERALPYYEESYRISADAFGPTHAESAIALAALALIRHEAGSLDQAGRDYAVALQLMADARVPALRQAKVRANQADLLLRTGRDVEARSALESVLATEQAHIGAKHPDVAYTLNALGVLADAQGRHDDALALYRRALAIRVEALPAGHPAIATVLANMAGTYGEMGNLGEARANYAQAISVLRHAHGDSHPDIAKHEAALRALDRETGSEKGSGDLRPFGFD